MNWFKRQPKQWVAPLALMTTVLMMNGCAIQKTEVSGNARLAGDPVRDARLAEQDFGFPSRPPQLSDGKRIYDNQCLQCHTAATWQQPGRQQAIAHTTPIDLYLMLTTGKAPEVTMATEERRAIRTGEHPAFREKLSRDDRWAVIMYTRYLAGAADTSIAQANAPSVDSIFGGNCAVCHGTKGQADGPLHIGKTGIHELKDGDILHSLIPPPANFQQYDRIFNRTDAQLFKYICEGIYPSAMPSWYGNVSRDKDTGEVQFVFDEPLISNLVRHVRSFTYVNDLEQAAPKGLSQYGNCRNEPTNQPWTELMQQEVPRSSSTGGAR